MLRLMVAMTKRNIAQVLGQIKAEIGSPHFSCQSDLWTTRNMTESYAALNVSFVQRIVHPNCTVEYKKQQALLALDVFPKLTHTGVHIYEWFLSVLKSWALSPEEMVMLTVDGGGNIVKAASIGKSLNQWDFQKCYAHQLQRCILYALGLAGKTSQNPRCKEVIQKGRRMIGAVNHSTQLQKLLREMQKQHDQPALDVIQDVITRWSSTFMFTERANLLEPFLISVLSNREVNETARATLELAESESVAAVLNAAADSDDDQPQIYVPDYAEAPVATPSEALLSAPEWDVIKSIEGFTKPVAQVVLMMEASKHTTADIAWPQIKVLEHTMKTDHFRAPLRMEVSSNRFECAAAAAASHLQCTRRQLRPWQNFSYAGQPYIKEAKVLFLKQLLQRFLDAGPTSNALKCMFLNPKVRPGLQALVGATKMAEAEAAVRDAAKARKPGAFEIRRSPRSSPSKRTREDTEAVCAVGFDLGGAYEALLRQSAVDSGRQMLGSEAASKTCMDVYAATPAAEVARATTYEAGPQLSKAAASTSTSTTQSGAGKLSMSCAVPHSPHTLPLSGTFDVLKFWAQQESVIPALCAVARAEFSSEATEASSERTFKGAGDIMSPLRQLMSTEVASMLVFLKWNQQWWPSVTSIVAAYLGEEAAEQAAKAAADKAAAEQAAENAFDVSTSRGLACPP
jgi:hypothetical protein